MRIRGKVSDRDQLQRGQAALSNMANYVARRVVRVLRPLFVKHWNPLISSVISIRTLRRSVVLASGS